MIGVIIFTLLIAVLIFLYMRHTTRKRKKRSAELNSVKDFHASYDRVRTRRELRDRHSGYQTYVTTARRITESGTNKTTAVAISYQIRKGSGSIPLPKYLRSIC